MYGKNNAKIFVIDCGDFSISTVNLSGTRPFLYEHKPEI